MSEREDTARDEWTSLTRPAPTPGRKARSIVQRESDLRLITCMPLSSAPTALERLEWGRGEGLCGLEPVRLDHVTIASLSPFSLYHCV